jgi:hypothetical protein
LKALAALPLVLALFGAVENTSQAKTDEECKEVMNTYLNGRFQRESANGDKNTAFSDLRLYTSAVEGSDQSPKLRSLLPKLRDQHKTLIKLRGFLASRQKKTAVDIANTKERIEHHQALLEETKDEILSISSSSIPVVQAAVIKQYSSAGAGGFRSYFMKNGAAARCANQIYRNAPPVLKKFADQFPDNQSIQNILQGSLKRLVRKTQDVSRALAAPLGRAPTTGEDDDEAMLEEFIAQEKIKPVNSLGGGSEGDGEAPGGSSAGSARGR